MIFPPPLMTSDPGSYARQTIVARKPRLIQQVIADNDYPSETVQALIDFQDEIASGSIAYLSEEAPDISDWNREVLRFGGKTWLQIPWYLAETYFYRRICEAVQYHQPGPLYHKNPFQAQKTRQMVSDVERLAPELDSFFGLEPEHIFEALLHSALWGNRTDLSNFDIHEKARQTVNIHSERDCLLIDHTDQVLACLQNGVHQVHFINDNVGADCLFDLALADFLLTQNWARQIVFHLKDAPFFVSDAMPGDILEMVGLLQTSPVKGAAGLGVRIAGYLTEKRLLLTQDPYWTSFRMFRHMPAPIRNALSKADLVILKGDVNYRRLLDDLHWPITSRLDDIVTYFPASFVSLRTLKAEILVGIPEFQAKAIQAEDPDWLINGRRGLIHYHARTR